MTFQQHDHVWLQIDRGRYIHAVVVGSDLDSDLYLIASLDGRDVPDNIRRADGALIVPSNMLTPYEGPSPKKIICPDPDDQ